MRFAGHGIKGEEVRDVGTAHGNHEHHEEHFDQEEDNAVDDLSVFQIPPSLDQEGQFPMNIDFLEDPGLFTNKTTKSNRGFVSVDKDAGNDRPKGFEDIEQESEEE